MNMLFQTILSMSVSGALLIVGVLLINRLLRRKCSRQWQYYVWLLVIARLLLPFGPEASLMGNVSRTVNRAVAAEKDFSEQKKGGNIDADFGETVVVPAQGEPAAVDTVRGELATPSAIQGRERDGLMQRGIVLAKSYIGMIWLAVALGMLIRKIAKYRSYIWHVKAGAEPVSDRSLQNALCEAQWQAGVGKEVELFVNPRIFSPMLIGFRRPCIVLPDADILEGDFRYIATHELMHYKRRDILYKWLVQFAVCLHWFNPLVYVMSHEISKACELSCDEAVLEILGYEHAADYGKTLLDAMAAVGKYKEPLTAVSLSANKRILKERLSAIMNNREKSKKTKILTVGLTASMILGVFFVGIYPANAAEASKASTESVNVKILREEDGKIIGAAYMTNAEVTELFGDMDEGGMSEGKTDKEKADNEGKEVFPRTMMVKDRVCNIRDGAGAEFKVVGLVAEGEELIVLGSKEDSNGQLWYLLDQESLKEKPDPSVKACYIRADLLWVN